MTTWFNIILFAMWFTPFCMLVSNLIHIAIRKPIFYKNIFKIILDICYLILGVVFWSAIIGDQNHEMVTTRTGLNMPFQIYGKNKADAIKKAKKKLRKGEKILSVRPG